MRWCIVVGRTTRRAVGTKHTPRRARPACLPPTHTLKPTHLAGQRQRDVLILEPAGTQARAARGGDEPAAPCAAALRLPAAPRPLTPCTARPSPRGAPVFDLDAHRGQGQIVGAGEGEQAELVIALPREQECEQCGGAERQLGWAADETGARQQVPARPRVRLPPATQRPAPSGACRVPLRPPLGWAPRRAPAAPACPAGRTCGRAGGKGANGRSAGLSTTHTASHRHHPSLPPASGCRSTCSRGCSRDGSPQSGGCARYPQRGPGRSVDEGQAGRACMFR